MEVSSRPLNSQYRFVIADDPALDDAAEGFVQSYLNYLDHLDESQLPMRQGQKPVVWALHYLHGWAEARLKERVRREAVRGVLGSGNVDLSKLSWETCYFATKLSIVGAENLRDPKSGGNWEVEFIDDDDGVRLATEASMGFLQRLKWGKTPLNICERIGREVVRRHFFAPLS